MIHVRELHVYGQEAPHEEVVIVGNRAALEAVVEQIQRVLSTGEPQRSDHFAGDGEGYRLLVALVDEPLFGWATPYTHEAFQDRMAPKSPWTHEGLVRLMSGPRVERRCDEGGSDE